MTGVKARLLLMRHGQTTHNASGRWQGWVDAPLSTVGEQQAAAAAEALAKVPVGAVVASDLQRARITAEVVAERHGLRVAVDKRLREINVGQWQGMTTPEVTAIDGGVLQRILDGEDLVRGVTGESLAQTVARGLPAVQEFLSSIPQGTVGVVVSHGAISRGLAATLVDWDPQQMWRRFGPLGNCHWAELARLSLGWRIEKWNEGAPYGS